MKAATLSPTAGESVALDRMFVACAVLALATIWGVRYPAGIDLPQHANILRILADYGDPGSSYASFYERQLLTPYILTYALALPFTWLFGALVAVKVMLSVAAVATPWTMIRWLRSIDGERWWGLFGFPLTFGFGYLWGLLSFVFAMPLVFVYFVAYRRLVDRPSRPALIIAAGWSVALCLCHGVSFTVAAMATGLEAAIDLLCTHRLRTFLFRLAHFAPGAAVLGAWQLKPGVPGVGTVSEWPPANERFVTFLSGEFAPWASYYPALAGAAVLLMLLFVGRPAMAFSPRRLVPLAVALINYLLLPEMIGPTWLVGVRMVMFVHAFGAAAFSPDARDTGKLVAVRVVSAALVLVCLAGHGVRAVLFNREMRGVTTLTQAMPLGVDLQNVVGETNPHSEIYGRMGTGQAAAWVTAANGGFLSNDSGGYFQLPIRRPPGQPWVTEYRWFMARGPIGTDQRVRGMVGDVRVVARADDWWLMESTSPPRALGGLEVVRYRQAWGRLELDHGLTSAKLKVAGQVYERGLATHALSRIQVRLRGAAGQRVSGRLGVDDSAQGSAAVVFRVLDTAGTLLFESPPTAYGQRAVPFTVALGGRTELLLAVDPAPSQKDNSRCHADWLDLRVDDDRPIATSNQ